MMTRGSRKNKVGLVLSNKMDKGIVVSVERVVRHALYGKFFKKTSKFMAHDENNDCHTGDQVRIIEHRPLSKRKRWKVQETVAKATGV